jgi:hypothetical protein
MHQLRHLFVVAGRHLCHQMVRQMEMMMVCDMAMMMSQDE